MDKAKITNFARGAWGLYQAFETLNAQERARDQERRAYESIEENRRVQRFIENPTASNKLGDGRLANLQDALAEGILDPNGLFLGRMDDKPVFYGVMPTCLITRSHGQEKATI